MTSIDRGTRRVLGVSVTITQYVAGDGSPNRYHVDLRRDLRLTPPEGFPRHPTITELEALIVERSLSDQDFTDRAASLGATLRHAVNVLREHEAVDPQPTTWVSALREQLEAEVPD